MALARSPLQRKKPLRRGKIRPVDATDMMAAVQGPPKSRRGSLYGLSTKSDPLRVLWSKIVRARDNHTCQRCGRTDGQISAAHILGAGAHANLKYLPANGISLCDGPRGSDRCHPWLDSNRNRDHDGAGDNWVKGKIGIDKYMKLLVLAKIYHRPSKAEVKILLREQAKEYGVKL